MTNSKLERSLEWTTTPLDPRTLEKAGFLVVDFARFSQDHIEPADGVGLQRSNLNIAAASAVEFFRQNPAVAMLNVPVETFGDLQRLYGFVVEPAYRNDCALFVHASKELEDLAPENYVESYFGYAWTLQRLNHLASRYHRRSLDASLPPMTPIELMLYQAMVSVGLQPRVQYGIGRHRVDFAFPERLLAVEADGKGWHDAHKDRIRDQNLAAQGWGTVRFTGSRIWREAQVCAEEIANLIHRRPEAPTYSSLELLAVKYSIWQRLFNWIRGLFGSLPAEPKRPNDEIESEIFMPPLRHWHEDLDLGQRAAITAHEGVTQVIAPAGSGKTRVMVDRVQELVSRGIPEERILCTTFNRSTVSELKIRLAQVGVRGAEVRSFNAVGRYILSEEHRLRRHTGRLSYAQWRRLSTIALDSPGGVWIDAPEAAASISNFKMLDMITPEEATQRAETPFQTTASRIYSLYEDELESTDRNDFDDQIINAVRLLKSDGVVRQRWQDKWECVLVDEYQDIEPPQELLIRLLAAPEDCLMAVGDEDQCIYTWRRAEVERIINLDKRYPALERVILSNCYRCPIDVVTAASQLIQNNKRRFPKDATSAHSTTTTDSIVLKPVNDLKDAASEVAKSLQDCDATETVVLARTTRLLRQVALACLASGVPFMTNNGRVLGQAQAEPVVLAYLKLISNPKGASASDVHVAFRVPNRYLPDGAEHEIARSLRAGASFGEAVDKLQINEAWRVLSLQEGAKLLDRLSEETDAEKVVQALRTEGGLDRYFSDSERMLPLDQIETETLDAILVESRGKTPRSLAVAIESRINALKRATAKDGVELSTIHGSKGREWNRVILYGWDDDQIPHKRTIESVDAELGEQAIEDERRLAYVAMTRTKERLEVVFSQGNPTQFLAEAGLWPPRSKTKTSEF